MLPLSRWKLNFTSTKQLNRFFSSILNIHTGAEPCVLHDCAPAASSLMILFSSATQIFIHWGYCSIIPLLVKNQEFIGNKCEVEYYREESHSLKLRSASVYIDHTREGVVGQQLTYDQKKSKVILLLAQIQMGKASTTMRFLVFNVKFSTSNYHNK